MPSNSRSARRSICSWQPCALAPMRFRSAPVGRATQHVGMYRNIEQKRHAPTQQMQVPCKQLRRRAALAIHTAFIPTKCDVKVSVDRLRYCLSCKFFPSCVVCVLSCLLSCTLYFRKPSGRSCVCVRAVSRPLCLVFSCVRVPVSAVHVCTARCVPRAAISPRSSRCEACGGDRSPLSPLSSPPLYSRVDSPPMWIHHSEQEHGGRRTVALRPRRGAQRASSIDCTDADRSRDEWPLFGHATSELTRRSPHAQHAAIAPLARRDAQRRHRSRSREPRKWEKTRRRVHRALHTHLRCLSALRLQNRGRDSDTRQSRRSLWGRDCTTHTLEPAPDRTRSCRR